MAYYRDDVLRPKLACHLKKKLYYSLAIQKPDDILMFVLGLPAGSNGFGPKVVGVRCSAGEETRPVQCAPLILVRPAVRRDSRINEIGLRVATSVLQLLARGRSACAECIGSSLVFSV